MERTNSVETESHHEDEEEEESNVIDDEDDDDDDDEEEYDEETLGNLIETNHLDLVNSIDLQRQLLFR